jgi:hypothetical protein
MFVWSRAAGDEERRFEVLPSHCPECIEEIRRQGSTSRTNRLRVMDKLRAAGDEPELPRS